MPIEYTAVPTRVPQAEWQAGVTAGNQRLKVMLDGEPLVGCVAASESQGWALVLPEARLTRVRPTSRFPLGWAYLTDWLADKVLLRGSVSIIPLCGSFPRLPS